MEKSNNSSGETEAAAQEQHGYTPSRMLHALRRALLDSKRANKELTAHHAALMDQLTSKTTSWEEEKKVMLDQMESVVVKVVESEKAKHKTLDTKLKELVTQNAALMEQLASKTTSWEAEKKEMLDQTESLVSTLWMVREDSNNLVKVVESERAKHKTLDTKLQEMEKKVTEKEEEVLSLKQRLHLQQTQTKKVKKEFKAKCNEVEDTKRSFDNRFVQLNAEWENRFTARQEEAVAELKALQDSCDEKIKTIIQKNNEETTSWEHEKKEMLDQTKSLVSTLWMVRDDSDNLVKIVESERAKHKMLDTKLQEMEKTVKEKEKEVLSLKERLHLQQTQAEKVEKEFKAKCDEVKDKKRSFDNRFVQLNAEWESRFNARQKEAVAEFKALQDSCDEKIKTIIQKNIEEITRARDETTALVEKNLQHLGKLKTIGAKMHQSELDWQAKVSALEESHREAEGKWLAKEEEWSTTASKMEEHIELLIQKNIDLQELALKSDKDKAKMKKQEKKAKEEAEKRLKEEEKKEEAEREKMVKWQQKRDKKEKKEREKKEKEERKEAKKKEKEKEKERKEKREE